MVGTTPLITGFVRAQADEVSGPLMAYVGTFSSPLRDMLPTIIVFLDLAAWRKP